MSTNQDTTQKPADEEATVQSTDEPVSETEALTEAPEAPEALSAEETVRETFDFAATWSDKEVNAWLHEMADRTDPFVEDTEVLVYDPRRVNRPKGDWMTAELWAFVEGHLIGMPNHQKASIIKELRHREEVMPAFTDDQVLDYYRKGVEPAKTSTGAWVVDVTRRERDVDQWSNEELQAWARGEIKAEGKARSNDLAITLKERLGLTPKGGGTEAVLKAYHQTQEKTQNARQVSEPETGLTKMNKSYIDDILARYYAQVKPGNNISDETGSKAQRELEQLFQYVLRLEGTAMVQGLDRIKGFVADHRNDVFGPSYAHRFTRLLKGNKVTQRRHMNMIVLLTMVTDPNKARRKQMDIRLMLRDFPVAQQDRLYDYFRHYA